MKAVIETTHLLLRPWREEDVDPLVRLLAKPEVARYIRLDGRSFTREETAEVPPGGRLRTSRARRRTVRLS